MATSPENTQNSPQSEAPPVIFEPVPIRTATRLGRIIARTQGGYREDVEEQERLGGQADLISKNLNGGWRAQLSSVYATIELLGDRKPKPEDSKTGMLEDASIKRGRRLPSTAESIARGSAYPSRLETWERTFIGQILNAPLGIEERSSTESLEQWRTLINPTFVKGLRDKLIDTGGGNTAKTADIKKLIGSTGISQINPGIVSAYLGISSVIWKESRQRPEANAEQGIPPEVITRINYLIKLPDSILDKFITVSGEPRSEESPLDRITEYLTRSTDFIGGFQRRGRETQPPSTRERMREMRKKHPEAISAIVAAGLEARKAQASPSKSTKKIYDPTKRGPRGYRRATRPAGPPNGPNTPSSGKDTRLVAAPRHPVLDRKLSFSDLAILNDEEKAALKAEAEAIEKRTGKKIEDHPSYDSRQKPELSHYLFIRSNAEQKESARQRTVKHAKRLGKLALSKITRSKPSGSKNTEGNTSRSDLIDAYFKKRASKYDVFAGATKEDIEEGARLREEVKAIGERFDKQYGDAKSYNEYLKTLRSKNKAQKGTDKKTKSQAEDLAQAEREAYIENAQFDLNHAEEFRKALEKQLEKAEESVNKATDRLHSENKEAKRGRRLRILKSLGRLATLSPAQLSRLGRDKREELK